MTRRRAPPAGAPVPAAVSVGVWVAGHSTCCNVEPVATLPSCFLSSSSSCMEILEAVAGALKLVVLAAVAVAASSALSLAFCCKYCRVCAHRTLNDKGPHTSALCLAPTPHPFFSQPQGPHEA